MDNLDGLVLNTELGVTERGALWGATRSTQGDRIVRKIDPRFCDARFLQTLAVLRAHPLPHAAPIVAEGWIEDAYCLEYALPAAWQMWKEYYPDLHWRTRLYTIYQICEAIKLWSKGPVHPLGLHPASIVMVEQSGGTMPWLLACPPTACTSPLDFWDIDLEVLACLPPELVRGVYSDYRLQDAFGMGMMAAMALGHKPRYTADHERGLSLEDHVRGRLIPKVDLEQSLLEAFLQAYEPLQQLAVNVRRNILTSPSARPADPHELQSAVIQALNQTEAEVLARVQLERDSDTDKIFEVLEWGFNTGSDSVKAREFAAELAMIIGDLDRAIIHIDQAANLSPGSPDLRRKRCDLRLVRMFASPEITAGQPDPEGDILLGELEWLLGATFEPAAQRELVVKTAQVYMHRQDLSQAANLLYLAVNQEYSDLNALYLYAKCLRRMDAVEAVHQTVAIAHDRIEKMEKSDRLTERSAQEWQEKFKRI